MLFGENIVDLRGWFGPDLPPQVLGAVHRVIAVKMHATGKMLSSASTLVGDVNHCVIGVAASGQGSTNLEAPAVDPTRSLSARRAAMSAGWLLKLTNAIGDCGIDCFSYHDNQARAPVVWKALRAELADFMMHVREDKVWHDVFKSCSEMRLGPGGRPGGSKAIGSMGPPPLPPPPMLRPPRCHHRCQACPCLRVLCLIHPRLEA